MKPFMLEVEFVNPRESTKFKRIFGPVYGKKAYNKLFLILIKKRNVIGIQKAESSNTDYVFQH
jgi:hypothetical protein